jgi:DNA-directed RNA polymerase subunit beta'
MGAEAVYELLATLDLETMSNELWHEVRFGRSAQRRKKATRQLRVVEALRKSHNRAEWMILTVLPGVAPELRPMVQGRRRFATSDLNDLYRRVINRNNRLKRLLNWARRSDHTTKNGCCRKRWTASLTTASEARP